MSPASNTSRKRILVVEDDEPSAILAEEALSLMGCEVVRAADGDHAVNLVFGMRFDLVFMDYHLPRMNGLEATLRIREREGAEATDRTAIVGLTASALPQERADCLRSGMDDVLLKPFKLAELRTMVARWAS
jgi:CheY-like chemotaxis protein